MSRQVFLVFFGEPASASGAKSTDGATHERTATGSRGRRTVATSVEPHARRVHPHESPWPMTVPLVVLAVCSVFGGLLNLPFADDFKFLEHWLAPGRRVRRGRARPCRRRHAGRARRRRRPRRAGRHRASPALGLPPPPGRGRAARAAAVRPRLVLRRVASPRFVGGPGRRLFDAAAWFDANVIDGAVNGAAALVGWLGGRAAPRADRLRPQLRPRRSPSAPSSLVGLVPRVERSC